MCVKTVGCNERGHAFSPERFPDEPPDNGDKCDCGQLDWADWNYAEMTLPPQPKESDDGR